MNTTLNDQINWMNTTLNEHVHYMDGLFSKMVTNFNITNLNGSAKYNVNEIRVCRKCGKNLIDNQPHHCLCVEKETIDYYFVS